MQTKISFKLSTRYIFSGIRISWSQGVLCKRKTSLQGSSQRGEFGSFCFLLRMFFASLSPINRKNSIRFDTEITHHDFKIKCGKRLVSEFAKFMFFPILKIIKSSADKGTKRILGQRVVSCRYEDHRAETSILIYAKATLFFYLLHGQNPRQNQCFVENTAHFELLLLDFWVHFSSSPTNNLFLVKGIKNIDNKVCDLLGSGDLR